MARLAQEKTDPCPCTNPERPQFEWLSGDREDKRCIRKGKRWSVNCDLIDA